MLDVHNLKAFVIFRPTTNTRGAHFKIYIGYHLPTDKRECSYITLEAYSDDIDKFFTHICPVKVTTVSDDTDIRLTIFDQVADPMKEIQKIMDTNNIKGKIYRKYNLCK